MTENILEVNNSFTTLIASKEVCSNIYDLLSYRTKDAYFTRQRMLFNWSKGYLFKGMSRQLVEQKIEEMCNVRLYDKKTNKFPTGLINKVQNHLKQIDIDFIVRDKRSVPAKSWVFRKVSQLPPLRYYQSDAIEKGLIKNRGIFEMATGCGKTNVIIELTYRLGLNTLIIVPSSTILVQFYDKLVQIFGKNKIGQITGGKKNLKKPITVATYQSLPNIEKEWFKNIDCLIIDEAHRCLSGKNAIVTNKGLKNISEIVNHKMQYKVKSYNISKNCWEWKNIINYWKYNAPLELIEITYKNDDGIIKTLKCTLNHKIYTKNRGYIEAQYLTKDDDIIVTKNFHCNTCEYTTNLQGKELIKKEIMEFIDE